jgi:hypothetical protein
MASLPSFGIMQYASPAAFFLGNVQENQMKLEAHKAFIEARKAEIDQLPKDSSMYGINKAISQALIVGGTGIVGFCMMMLLLKALFSGGGEGGGILGTVAKAVGI